MITNDILNQIYHKILSGEIISSKELVSCGVNYNDIGKLMDEGVLERLERGKYGLISFESLYNYGIYLIKEEQYLKATNIFQKCLTINSNHQETYLYLLYISIKNKYYSKSFEILDKLIEIQGNTKRNNLYLYLLSYITVAYPKKYNKKVKNMKNKDIFVNSRLSEEKLSQLANNPLLVINYVEHIDDKEFSSQIEKLILKELVTKLQVRENKFYQKILELIQKENYQAAIASLVARSSKVNLNCNYQYILTLCGKISSILKTNKIPPVISYNEWTITSAIDYNNFPKAMSLYNNYLNKMGLNKDEDIVSILLTRINDLTKKTIQNEKFNCIFKTTPRNKKIENILINLFENDMESATKLLRIYLKEIGKEEYEYLIINLIKISLCESDELFLKPASVLQELSTDEYVYNLSFYLQDFYFYLLQNKTGTAKIYLDIISRYSKESSTIINSLQNDLNTRIQRAQIESNQDKELLLTKLQEMKEKKETIIILEPLPSFKRKTIYEIIKSIPELIGFSIGNEPKTLVLRYIDPKVKKEKYTYKIKKATALYYQKAYQESIKLSLELLQHPDYSPYRGHYAYIYAQLGLSYLNLKNISEAIKYLTIATELNKEDPQGLPCYDFTDLLFKIKNNSTITENDIDDAITSSSEFPDDLNDNYGVTKIEEIAYYISKEKLSIQDACQKFNLSDEQILLVKLIYARDYYSSRMYQQGDKLLQEVEKSKDKTKKVRDILNELRKNKLFYQTRSGVLTRRKIL